MPRSSSRIPFRAALVCLAALHTTHGFGIPGGKIGGTNAGKKGFRGMTIPVSEIAESVNGEIYGLDPDDAVADEIDDLLVSATSNASSTSAAEADAPEEISPGSATIAEEELPEVSPSTTTSSESIAPFAPALTYTKFLTMQSKRVPVAIRYSADAGMKPYFLTVAQKIKDAHPDVILDRVILPKLDTTGDGKADAAPTFEILVDGRVVVPTLGKKDRMGGMSDVVFVSMQELEVAISRARRRRRPSTAYGAEESNVRLEMLKAKADATAPGRVSSD